MRMNTDGKRWAIPRTAVGFTGTAIGWTMPAFMAFLLLAMLVAAAMFPLHAWAASPKKADESTATTKILVIQDSLDNKWDYDGSHITTRYRWSVSRDTGNYVYCISPGVAHGPFEGESQKMSARLLRPSDFKSDALYKACLAALYYAPGGPGYETDEGTTGGLIGRRLFPDEDYKGGSFSKKDRFGCAHCLMGYYYNDLSWDKTYPRADWQPASSYVKWFTREMLPARWGGSGTTSYGQQALDHYNDQDMMDNGGYTVEAWEDSVYLLMSGSDETLQDLLTYVDAPRGPLKLEKKSGDTGITDNNLCYSLRGAEYEVFNDAALKHKMATMITDAEGKATLDNVVTGTYYVRESVPGKGYKLDPTVYTVKVKKDTGGSFTSKEEPLASPLEMLVEKDGLGETDGIPQGEASLQDAEFTISYYAGQYTAANLPDKPARTWVVKTNEQGKVPASELASLKVSGPAFYSHAGKTVFPLGTVTVQETKEPRGYLLADSQGNTPPCHVVNITEDSSKHAIAKGYAAPKQEDAPKLIGVRIWKIDAMLGIAQAQGDASLEGALFSVVNESAYPVKVDGTYYKPGDECLVLSTKKTDEGFVAEAITALPYGNYSLREKEPPVGYLPNEDWAQTITVNEDTQHGDVFEFRDDVCEDMVKRGGIRVPKVDRELQEAIPLGAATLEGAEFTIRLESDQPVVVDGGIFRPGEDVKTIVTDGDGIATTGEKDLPYATYSVRETKAPRGYVLNDGWRAIVEVREDGKVYETEAAPDQVIRGDVRLNKVHEDTMARMGFVPFLVTSKTTGERHIVVADENGNLDTSAAWAKHTQDTNANDAFLPPASEDDAYSPGGEAGADAEDGDGDSPATGEEGSSGTAEGEPDSEDGSSQEGEGDEDGAAGGGDDATHLTLSEAGLDNDLAEGEDGPYTVDVKGLLTAIASALGADSATTADADGLAERIVAAGVHGDVEFTVALAFGDEKRNQDLIATLQEDGSVVVRDAETDDDVAVLEGGDYPPVDPGDEPGGPGEGESSSSSSGGEGPDPGSSSSSGEGDESSSQGYDGEGDGDSNGDTDGDTGEDQSDPADGEGGSDSPDEQTHGVEPIDSSKLDIHAGTWFNGRTDRQTTPDDALGALPYDTYTFEELRSDSNQGMRLVSFEVNISRHGYDIDLGTVDDKPISIATELKSENGTHMVAATEQVTLVDSVQCTNVQPGKSYELHGYLVDKQTGDAIGNTVKQPFEAESGDMEVDVTFTIDTSALAGHSVVAYQELYEEGVLVAEHKDINDAAETVFIPRIATTLTDASGEKAVVGSSEVELADRVDYENLEVGHTYTLTATLHAKSPDGDDLGIAKDASGKDIEAQATFESQAQSGSAVVTFTFDGSKLDACELVAFENLSMGDAELASHEDIGDASQTISLEPTSPEEPNQPEEETPTPGTPSSPTHQSGKQYDKTGDILEQFWWMVGMLGASCAMAWSSMLAERRPTYSAWGASDA